LPTFQQLTTHPNCVSYFLRQLLSDNSTIWMSTRFRWRRFPTAHTKDLRRTPPISINTPFTVSTPAASSCMNHFRCSCLSVQH